MAMRTRTIIVVVATCILWSTCLPVQSQRLGIDPADLDKEITKNKAEYKNLSGMATDVRNELLDPEIVFVEGTIKFRFRGIPMSRREISHKINKTDLWKAAYFAWYEVFLKEGAASEMLQGPFKSPQDLYDHLLSQSKEIRERRKETLERVEHRMRLLTEYIANLEEQRAQLQRQQLERREVREPVVCMDVEGVWAHNTKDIKCESTWHLKKTGPYTYEATEHGCGRGTGPAKVDGRRLNIEFTCKSGCTGIYVWDLDATCRAGSGHVYYAPNPDPHCKGQRETPKATWKSELPPRG
jgi:hypothetical protein